MELIKSSWLNSPGVLVCSEYELGQKTTAQYNKWEDSDNYTVGIWQMKLANCMTIV